MEERPGKYEKVESLFSAVIEKVPTLPFVVMRLLEVAESDTSSADDIRKILETDHSLAAKTLKLANSAFYGKSGSISNVRNAIVLMGINALKNMALSLSVRDLFDGEESQTGFDLHSFWLHSLACALCARDIGKHIKAPFAEEALVCGMLHDVGKTLVNQYLPEEYSKVIEYVSSSKIGMAEAEKSILGVDHAVAGSWLLKEWKFPSLLSNAILFHHRFSEKTLGKDRSFKLAALVNLSNNIVHIHRIGSGGDEIPRCIDETIMNCLGLTEDDVGKIAAGLHEKIWETANSMGFSVERKTYLEILEESNKELQDSEEKYRILSESPMDSSFLLSDVIHDCNEQACRLLAFERDDILGLIEVFLFPGAIGPRIRDAFQICREMGTCHDMSMFFDFYGGKQCYPMGGS
jgi:HD-like signal output (HDOD) protein